MTGIRLSASLDWTALFDGLCDLTPQWWYNGVNQLAKHKESGDREAHRVIVPVRFSEGWAPVLGRRDWTGRQNPMVDRYP